MSRRSTPSSTTTFQSSSSSSCQTFKLALSLNSRCSSSRVVCIGFSAISRLRGRLILSAAVVVIVYPDVMRYPCYYGSHFLANQPINRAAKLIVAMKYKRHATPFTTTDCQLLLATAVGVSRRSLLYFPVYAPIHALCYRTGQTDSQTYLYTPQTKVLLFVISPSCTHPSTEVSGSLPLFCHCCCSCNETEKLSVDLGRFVLIIIIARNRSHTSEQ